MPQRAPTLGKSRGSRLQQGAEGVCWVPLKLRRAFIISCILLATSAGVVLSQLEGGRTRNPHGALEIPCQNCHASSTWKPIRSVPDFDHSTQTKYPLHGRHRTVGCVNCHVKPSFSDTGTACSSCHADLHRRQFGSSCENCHTVQGWSVKMLTSRQHLNRFPLAGAHAALECESCHSGAAVGTFTALSTTCISCHAADYNAAKTIDHKAAGFSTSCESCHTMSQWLTFNHNVTRFPLTGAHVSTMCTTCHVNGRFAGTPMNCDSCHATDYNQTSNPNHPAAGFSRDCALCHTTSLWRPASIDHSRTRFPLTGAHTALSCSTCHVNGQFATLDTSCVSCHVNQFNATTSPNHLAAAFPRDCQLCHSTTRWAGATFDHSRTRFTLTGAHTTVQCASCHIGGRYAGTPSDCYSCHSGEFTSVSNPNHVAAGFPKTCETCHTTTAWAGARVNHTFPIYSGSHAGKWTSCNDCHTNSSNYSVFSCINCHAHDKPIMDSKHSAISGYAYNSLTCYSCHPTGKH